MRDFLGMAHCISNGHRAPLRDSQNWKTLQAQCIHHSLHVLDECVDRFVDTRLGNGFEHEIRAVSAEFRSGSRESSEVPLAHSLRTQELMDRIRAAFAPGAG